MRDLIEELKDLQEATVGNDLDKIHAAFLSITPAKRMNTTKSALEKLLKGYEAGEIYNVDYKDAKDILGYAVRDTWRDRTNHFWAGRGGNNPESDFEWWVGSISGLNDVLSRKKKLDKAKPSTKISTHSGRTFDSVDPAFVQAAREIIDAAYPVAVIIKELKTKVVKGRKPLSPEKAAAKAAQLAKKDIKTCACCFRPIARLKNGLIADHGYTLPQQWMKTASCPGMRFQPLEVSDEGLKYMVDLLSKRVSALKTRIAGTSKLKTLQKQKGYKNVVTITPDDPSWATELKAFKTSLEHDLKYTESTLSGFEDKLKNWKPIPDAK